MKESEVESVAWPFRNRSQQKTASIILLLIGIYLMFMSVPFYLNFGSLYILSSALGLFSFLVGVGYFIEGL